MPSGGPAISGSYRLVVTAASGCSALPDWARRREHEATISQPGTDAPGAFAALTLSVRLESGVAPQFDGWINGSRVSFSFPGGTGGGGWYYYYAPIPPPFSYRLDSTSQYTITGEARATKGGSHVVQLEGTLNGAISAANPSTNGTIGECNSRNHQFSLTRR